MERLNASSVSQEAERRATGEVEAEGRMSHEEANEMPNSRATGFVLLCAALAGCGGPPPAPGPKTAALIAALRSAEVAEGSSVEIAPPFATGTWIISAAYCLEGRWPSLGVSLPASDREWLFEFNNGGFRLSCGFRHRPLPPRAVPRAAGGLVISHGGAEARRTQNGTRQDAKGLRNGNGGNGA